ncbi:MAG: hydrolase glyoxylase [Burkholderiales bacterium]|nr:MAG: hydrolase glyoxylase [Burkholderiales bacterium]
MLFLELNHGKCKTYLLGCDETRRAALIDPLRERIERYLGVLAYHGYRLEYVIDTHTHADHRTGLFELGELTGAKRVMHRQAPAPHVDLHVDEGDALRVGNLTLKVLHTPGHTPDSMSLYAEDRVFTGDTLLIRGTGRADFAGGDPGLQYDSIVGKLCSLPDETLVYPAHDYRGNTRSTVGEEKRLNPRLAGRTREQYVELMNNLGLPLPEKIQEVLQPNQTALDDDVVHFPTMAQLSQVRQLSPEEVYQLVQGGQDVLLLDVREPEEYRGELGHVSGSRSIPLKELANRAGELEALKSRPVVAICRAGVRSTTAAAILTSLGFEQVYNLKGGMLAWNDRGLPVER